MNSNKRFEREIQHAEVILNRGEEVWNWSSPAGQIRWRRRCGLFTSFIVGRHRTILEIGCGTGLFTQCFASLDCELFSIDISKNLLEQARKRIPASNVTFKVDNVCRSGFESGCFDYIVGSSILHHLEVKSALREIFRLLKPGGKCLFTEPNMMNPQIALQKNIPFLKRWAGDSPDETAFFRWGISKKFKNQGFINVHVEPFDFLHPAIPKVLLPLFNPLALTLETVPLLREIAGSLIISAEKPGLS
ncbi:MAG: class I SAM-dependent methyltransferase, partial [Acidobacteriota bacterium]